MVQLVCFPVWLFISADYFHLHPAGRSLVVASTIQRPAFVVSLLARRLALQCERPGDKPSFGGFGDPALNPQTSTPRREKEHPMNFARETLFYTTHRTTN